MVMEKTLAIIGCGQMATAIGRGLANNPSPLFASVVCYDIDPGKSRDLAELTSASTARSLDEAIGAADVVLLAVKPQVLPGVLDEARWPQDRHQAVVSIAAGITTVYLETRVGPSQHVVRVMPNTPCLVGEGAIVVAGGSRAGREDLDLVVNLFSTLGKVWVVPETLMDAVTAVSGSGPAYVYLVAEAMMDAAVDAGLPRDLARGLVMTTMEGAVALWKATGQHPAILREQVSSPGGTTIAALRKLEENGVRRAFFEAIGRAKERSEELRIDTGKGGVS